MEFRQKSVKLLFFIFAFIFVGIYSLSADLLQLKSYNIMSKLTVNNKIASDDVVLVVIDDKSLHEIGRWPWKREYYLEIFDFLENHTKALQIGYDGLIVAPDSEHPQSDKKFFSEIGKYNKLTAGYAFSLQDFEQGVDGEYYNNLLKTKSDIKIIDKRSKNKKNNSAYKSFTVLQKQFFENVKNLGFVNVPKDFDGYIRRVSQLNEFNGDFYPAMGLEIYSKMTGVKEFLLTDKFLYGFSDNYTLKIPVKSEFGSVSNYICYYKTQDGVYSHKKYSASDVINSYRAIKQGKEPILNPEIFKDKVVFVGANANAQALADVLRTPISESFSGLDIQATNLDNLIKSNSYVTVANLYNFLVCMLMFIVVFALVIYLPVAPALLSSLCIMFCYLLFPYVSICINIYKSSADFDIFYTKSMVKS